VTLKVSSFPASRSWKSVRLQISQFCNQLQSFTRVLRSWRPSDFVGPTGSDQAAGADVVIGGLIRLGCGIRCPEIQCSLRSAFPQRGKLPTLSAHPARRRRPSIARPGAAVSAGIAAYQALRVFVSQQSIRTFLCETMLPAPHHRATDIGLGRHLLHWPAVRAVSTTSTRSMYLRGWLRSDAIASSRFLSDALNNTHIVCAMRIDSRVVNEQNMSVH
jgi:hypothetical protein